MSITIALPVVRDPQAQGGYAQIETFKALVRQNLKNILLTASGERIMDPNFGVGLRNYLFEQNKSIAEQELRAKIYEQVQRYYPIVQIDDIVFEELDEKYDNYLKLAIHYTVLPLGMRDYIEQTVTAEISEEL